MSDLISRLSELRSQYNCFEETERDAYHTLSDAIEALQAQKTGECIPSKAVKIFTEAYRKTQTRLYVKKPMSYAFYEVWKYYDRHEKPRW